MRMSCSRRWVADIRTRTPWVLRHRSPDEFCGDPFRLRPPDVTRPAELLEEPDGTGGEVDLPPQYPVPRAGRVGVVQVVPAFPERQDRQRPEVGGLVALTQLERALPDDVADR